MEIHPLKSWRLLLVLSLGSMALSRHCDHRHYWDSAVRVCLLCSRCPRNEIIHQPCGEHTDTVCGPFREFNSFKQLDPMDSSYTSYEYESFLGENSSGVEHSKGTQHKTKSLQNEPIVEKDDGEYWKNLAFALIGVVCVLICLATLVVLMACRKIHHTSAVKRPEEDEDDDSGYVVIRAIRPPNMVYRPSSLPSSGFPQSPAATALLASEDGSDLPLSTNYLAQRPDVRLKGAYKPKRRLLNYDADDVFESEDSSGSRGSRRAPLQAIPERSVSSDNENVKDSDLTGPA